MSYIIKSAEEYKALYPIKKFLIGNKGFIAGGCFKHLLLGDKVKDFDMFFECKEDYDEARRHFLNNNKYVMIYENDKVTAFRYKETNEIIECNKYLFGSPIELLNNFDFTVTKIAAYLEETDDIDQFEIMYHPDFFEHLFLKRIVIDDKIVKPFSTFDRIIRYTKYGFYPCRDTKVKLCEVMSNTGFNNMDLSKSMYDGID